MVQSVSKSFALIHVTVTHNVIIVQHDSYIHIDVLGSKEQNVDVTVQTWPVQSVVRTKGVNLFLLITPLY